MKNALKTEPKRTAQDVYLEMEADIFSEADRKDPITYDQRMLSKHVYDCCCNFLEENRIMRANTNNIPTAVVSMESYNPDFQPVTLGNAKLDALVAACRIPAKHRTEAKKAIAGMLARMEAAQGSNDMYRSMHFSHGNKTGADLQALKATTQTVFAPSLHHVANNIGLPSMESFGVAIDRVLPDIRASMAVTLLQFHRGLQDRIIHRRTSASPYVKYVVPYAEVYDMLESNNKDHMVRNEGDHIIPFIDLYGNPRQVSNILRPIVPLASNDTKGDLYADGIVKFDRRCNIFDLSMIPNELGMDHINYTDLVSENVVLDSVYLQIQKGQDIEIVQVHLAQVNGARLNMQTNVIDSGLRATILQYTTRLDQRTRTITGDVSKILAPCTDSDFLKVEMTIAAQINIKYADVEGMGHVMASVFNRDFAQPAKAVTDMAQEITISLIGYTLDARFSEENLRKSNLAIRYNVRTFDFEISNGRNIMIDYSFEEELPEFLMSLVTEATSLGADHRCIDIIIKELMHVYDVTNIENQDPHFRSRLEKIGFQYISSQLVRPCVYLNTIDVADVDNIRSGDWMGDVRSYVEWELLNLCSLIYQNSYYKHQLRPGEKPVFKCVTSAVILENILSIPHYHNHLNEETSADGSTVEYRRVLPNGTILDCVTCTYDYMRDKIFMIPYIENDPESVLNFASNWDYGTFVAHYNPQLENAVNKRVFSNTRQLPIPQCPIGLYIDVKNISKFIDMFQLVGNTSGKEPLPQPSDILREEFEKAVAQP